MCCPIANVPAAPSAARPASLPRLELCICRGRRGGVSPCRRGVVSTTIVDRLELDAAAETRRIAQSLRVQVGETLRRGGIVVAMSGGVDSSLCAALAVEAVGPGHVLGLGLPERESDPQSLALARDWAARLAIEFLVEDITATLEACGCYERRDAAVRRLVPDYGPGWRSKLVLDGGGLDSDRLNVCSIAVQPPGQKLRKVRLPARELREIVPGTKGAARPPWPPTWGVGSSKSSAPITRSSISAPSAVRSISPRCWWRRCRTSASQPGTGEGAPDVWCGWYCAPAPSGGRRCGGAAGADGVRHPAPRAGRVRAPRR